ncbi:FAD dependent oxidoreductase [Gracilaria domingensis]|nr:FAD dependent oxidoreductase [Gracilaria domingensis]
MQGLSTAFELAQRGAAVRIIEAPARRPAALAAAGMLAPSAEKLSPPLLGLAEQSLHMYPTFVNNVQAISGVDVQYVARSDFLVPFFEDQPGHHLIRGDAVRIMEPALSERVLAVESHPRDAAVDSRRLAHALRLACEKLGVTFDKVPVRKIAATRGTHVTALESQDGKQIHASHFIVSAGAWTNKLLPKVPVRPIKGQMISLVPPPGAHSLLNHVIYSKVYIVPKNDFTEYYVGATVEERGFDSRNTAAGIKYLIDSAVELIPSMTDYEIREMWTGFRPGTPDEKPIFGPCSFDNLSVVTGCHRNGVLLAPIAAKIGAAYAMGQTDELSSEVRQLLGQFTVDRFYQNGLSKQAHASPTHTRPSEVGATHSTSDKNMPKSSTVADKYAEREVKLWMVTSNGISEPIYPPGWKGPKNVPPRSIPTNDSGKQLVPPTSTQQASTPSSQSKSNISPQQSPPSIPTNDSGKQLVPPTFTQQEPTPSSQSETNISPQHSGSRNPEDISAVDDAYDDILHKRGPDMHDKMSEALAKNRAFGREPSSLQQEGGPVLSISEKEVQRYDAAAEMGYRDMQEMEKCFDSNHESITATKAEAEESGGKELTPKIVIGGMEFNGFGPGK